MNAFAEYDVERCRARILARNDALNAVLTAVQPAPPEDPSGPLAGVPYVLKDTWDTEGITTTGGSWRYRHRIPTSSSHIHRALERAGAVLLGKSNLCDLAFSTESNNHLIGPTSHPADLSRTAGGSTGGGAAAVADGMAAFEWGSDFGGSIRGPAAYCGVVGLRLSASAWPVGFHHFPRLPPFFWDMCGMGPITRTVEGAREVVNAVKVHLKKTVPVPKIDPDRVIVWAPDRAHEDEWPSFISDIGLRLHEVGVGWSVDERLPTQTQINSLFNEYLSAHFGEFVRNDDFPLAEALPKIILGLLSGGRLDKSVHPNTGILLTAVAALRGVYRDKPRAVARREAAASKLRDVWASGALVVSPTVAVKPPRHGRGVFATRSMSFCKYGNLADATGLAVPFGTFPGTPAFPRSVQIMGPPGSEDAVLDLGARLTRS